MWEHIFFFILKPLSFNFFKRPYMQILLTMLFCLSVPSGAIALLKIAGRHTMLANS